MGGPLQVSHSVRPEYVLRQLDVIYARAWTQHWMSPDIQDLLETTLPVIHVNRIWVKPNLRKRGYGHSLLQHLCQDADHVPAVLTIQIEPDHPSDEEWIRRMYSHAGFVPMKPALATAGMVRWPAL